MAWQTFRDPFADYRLNGPIGPQKTNGCYSNEVHKSLDCDFLNFMNFIHFIAQVEGATLRP